MVVKKFGSQVVYLSVYAPANGYVIVRCFVNRKLSVCIVFTHRNLLLSKLLGCYMVKPHGQLVLVSLTHCCASTPNLATSWSRTTLQGNQVPGKSNLQASFTLRCFQRLSLPYLATLRCYWRNNRYTSGTSTPVLSY